MVAFCGIVMAKTSELKEGQIVIADNCAVLAALTVNIAEQEYHNETGKCFDSWVYNFIYYNALENCK